MTSVVSWGIETKLRLFAAYLDISKEESEFRASIVQEACSWIGTPYRKGARVKGVGCNCAQFLYGVAQGAKVLPGDSPEPRRFSEQFALNEKRERIAEYVMAYGGIEIEESASKPGDIVLYKTGQSHGHAAILVDDKTIVHCVAPAGCQFGAIDEGALARYSRRYFTLWRAE